MNGTVAESSGVIAVTPRGVKGPERRSARTGKLPRTAYNALREKTSPEFGNRIAAARRELADELYPDQRNCIAKLRLRAGLSQVQLAERAGITQPHLAKIEAGKLSIKLATAVALADALQVGLDALRPLVSEERKIPMKVSFNKL